MPLLKRLVVFCLISLLAACGTHSIKYSHDPPSKPIEVNLPLEQRIYLIGDAGGAKAKRSTDALEAFQEFIKGRDTSKDFLLYLGDNIYEKGMRAKGHKKRAESEHRIDVQLEAAKAFKGETVFIPGNHDWYSNGLKGLKRQEEYVEEALDDNEAFQPENGCPVETIELTDEVVLLVIDSQWYISNWDDHPTINDECDIKSRRDFFLEVEDELKDHNGKTILVSIHHPAITYGPHGGFYNSKQHLFPTDAWIPLPGLASLITQVRSLGGVSPQDRYNKRYNQLMNRLITLLNGRDRVMVVSGHEHVLQYIEAYGIKQIVSGAGSKRAPVHLGKGARFVSGEQGFAVVEVYANGVSKVDFYDATNGKPHFVYSSVVHTEETDYALDELPGRFPQKATTSIYNEQEALSLDKDSWFMGDHYRYLYYKDLEVPVATLDTLYGGLMIERKGGGHQTRSLRLQSNEGRTYALRAVKKSAVQFLQTVVFTDSYIREELRDTFAEEAVMDFYTSSYPFGAFVATDLAKAAGIYHTNPMLFYMPKHGALGNYNADYGDELYMIEERPDNTFLDRDSFGRPDAIESSMDVLENLRKDEKYSVDQPAFIRARLFDMLLGDWDRHQDQWRWARFDISEHNRIYRPIPRDRDQVFSNYDGALLDVLKFMIPPSRQFQEFDKQQRDLRWLNLAGVKLDRTLLSGASKEQWITEANQLVAALTDQAIDQAFANLPEDIQDTVAQSIMEKLKSRRDQLPELAEAYYKQLSRLLVITGTDKDDHISIERQQGLTRIEVSRIKGGEVQPPFKTVQVDSRETEEVWIYGLDDDDRFVAQGAGRKPVPIRIIGGQNNDIYELANGRAIKVYDHKSKPNTIKEKGGARIRLTDHYYNNVYDYRRYISRTNNLVPILGFNPDDGMILGLTDTFTTKGFVNQPFSSRHRLAVRYFAATSGFGIGYDAEFARFAGSWNLVIGGHYTTDNFTRNFFGFGNQTGNPDNELGLDYNRVRTALAGGYAGIERIGEYGSNVKVTAGISHVNVQNTTGRFVSEIFADDPDIFEGQTFGQLRFEYTYSAYDRVAAPTRGMWFALKTGVTTNVEETDRTFGHINPELEFYNALSRDRKLVLRSKVQGQFNLGNDFEFYQGAVLGADTGLRGYRTERFSGNSAFAAQGDLRYEIGRLSTGIVPLGIHLFGGYDIGRVWLDGERSRVWHDSVGGGLLVSALDTLSAKFNLFNSDDGWRFTFGLRFKM